MAPVLGYWDLRGLGSSIRNLLHYKGVEFEDKKYQIGPAPEWLTTKPTLRLDFPNLPYYIDGNVKLSQSITILRHLGRKYDLVGDTEDEILCVELVEQQAVDLHMDLVRVVYFNTNYESDRTDFIAALPGKLEQISKFLGTNKWIVGDKLTYGDFLLYDVIDFCRLFDEKSFDGCDLMNSYLTRFEEIPEIKSYMTSGKYKKLPVFGPMAAWGGQQE